MNEARKLTAENRKRALGMMVIFLQAIRRKRLTHLLLQYSSEVLVIENLFSFKSVETAVVISCAEGPEPVNSAV